MINNVNPCVSPPTITVVDCYIRWCWHMTVQMDWHDDVAIGMSGAMSYILSSTMMDTIRKIVQLYLTLLYRLMMMQLLPVDGYGVYTVPSGTARQ